MLGAAGAVEAIITLLILLRGNTPGTFGCREADRELPADILTEKDTARLTGRIGISESLAFGGGNSALVLEAFEP